MESLETQIKLEESDLKSYSMACLRALEVVAKKNPARMVCLLRGGYPPSRVVHGLAKEYLGKTLDKYLIPTSDFLRNKGDLVHALTNELLEFSRESHNEGKVFTIDTAISGSSSRQFMADFAENFKKIAYEKREFSDDVVLDYSLVRLWHDSEGRYSPTKSRPFVSEHRQRADHGQGKNMVLRFSIYDFGVRNLMSEDNPVLLGLDYPIEFDKEINGGIHGQKSEYVSKVSKSEPIVVVKGNNEIGYQPQSHQTTAELFVSLLTQKAKDQIEILRGLHACKPVKLPNGQWDVDPKNPYRMNLQTLEYPPYLVDFCGRLVQRTDASCK